MPLVVLVTFSCRTGQTETLALSHAVGAVQGRALIRLRRLDDSAVPGIDDSSERRRMVKEYVAPTEADLMGADAIAIAAAPGTTPSTAEWASYLALIARLGSEGKLAGKVAAIVATGDASTVTAMSDALLAAGLVVVPPAAGASDAVPAAATAHGLRVATVARALKNM
jgi:hypothetical protein